MEGKIVPFFSIIVPVFNSEIFLTDCLESILRQKYTDYEVILVDDGSTDNSRSICEHFASSDSRFKYVYQDNQGTSAARNAGLGMVSGSYITFMDNDDIWVGEDALGSIKAILDVNKADIVVHESFEFRDIESMPVPDCKTEIAKRVNSMAKCDALKELIKHRLFAFAVWSKVYSRDVVFSEENNTPILFPNGRRNEDTYWTGKVIRKARSIAFSPKPFYAYRKGTNYAQTSKPLTMAQLNDLAWVCLDYIIEVKNESVGENREALFAYICYPYVVWMGQSGLFEKKSLDSEIYEKMKDERGILRFSKDRISKVASLSCGILGFEFTRRILSVCLRLKHL